MDHQQINLSALPRARAIYDNKSDSPQELNFKAGEILHVVEKDVAGYQGWWLCYSNDKMGIAPGNRLRMMSPDEARTSARLSGESTADEQPSNYDVPVRLTAGTNDGDPWKMRQDSTPPHHGTLDYRYDRPTGPISRSPNRTSLLSIMSTGSSGLSDSARSSVDASSTTYDVLPVRSTLTSSEHSPIDQRVTNSSRGKCVEDQRDSYLEDYSVPRRASDVAAKDAALDLYDSPRCYQQSAVQSLDQNSDQLYDIPQFHTLEKVHAVLLKPFDDLKLSTSPHLVTGIQMGVPEENYDSLSSHYDNHDGLFVSEENKNLTDGRPTYPEPLIPILKWQSDIQKHNSKLRGYIQECGEGSSDGHHYTHSHIKLCCLSLKTAVKELVDLCSGTKNIINSDNFDSLKNSDCKNLQSKKQFDYEKLRIKVDMLKAAVRQFEDCSNDLVNASPSRGFQSKPDSIGQLKLKNHQLKELLGMANVLPQITNLLVIDLCSQFGVSLHQDKRFDPVKVELDGSEGTIYSPLPSLHAKSLTFGESKFVTNDQNSIRNRPLPPTPPLVQEGKNRPLAPHAINTLPLQIRQNMSGSHVPNNVSNNNSLQRLSFPTFSGVSNDANVSNTLPIRKSILATPRLMFQRDANVSMRTEAPKKHNIETPQSHCPLQKPYLPCQINFYDGVGDQHRHHPAFNQSSLEVRSMQDHERQLNPLLGSAESDALLVDFYASQIDGHMELVKKAAADFKKLMTEFSDEGRSNRHTNTPPRPIPSNHASNNYRHQNPNMQFSSQIASVGQFNQSCPTPKEFVLRSKFVILAAHKLVYVADAIARNLAEPSRYNDVAVAANGLCDVLKVAVNATKEAALSHDSHLKRDLMNSSIAEVEIKSGELCRVISKHRRPSPSRNQF